MNTKMNRTQKKKYMYPKSDDGLGGAGLDFSQAIRSSNLGEALCVLNPLQQKTYEQQAVVIDRAKRRREVTLFQNQRNFFIAQVFGKGLNPHLVHASDSEVNATPETKEEEKEVDIFKNPHKGTILDDMKATNPSYLSASSAQSRLPSKPLTRATTEVKHEDKQEESLEEEVEELQIKKRKTVMITEPGEIITRSHNKEGVLRSHTSSELCNSKQHSKSMTSLPLAEPAVRDGSERTTNKGTGHLKERSKSTSHLGSAVKKKVVTKKSDILPTIQHGPAHRRRSSSIQDISEEESDVETRSDRASLSIHTTTDHVGISTKIRANKKDIGSLKKDPTKLFPKMKFLLNSYDAANHGTFNQIMQLDGDKTGGSADVSSRRRASKSAAPSVGSTNQRVRIKLREHQNTDTTNQITVDEVPNCRTDSRPKYSKSKSASTHDHEDGRTKQASVLAVRARLRGSRLDLRRDDSCDEDAEDMGKLEGKDLTETQKYVKMIQQLTAYLPAHLLTTAEEQISKMSNTEGIMKFKKQMIEKNHSLMKQDTKADPRWRRLEGMLSSEGKQGTWHRRHQAWIYY